MLRRYPSIARRFPHRKSVDGHHTASRTNAEASNQLRYEVVSKVVDPGMSSEASACLRETRDVAVMAISVSAEEKKIDFRDDPSSATIPA
jgi:hypothetical protein